MPETEKKLANQLQEVADSIPAPFRAAALEKTNTYLSGLADMARLVALPAPKKEDEDNAK